MGSERIRKIIHVDMDAFYASVEIRDRPELAGQPVVVGGPPAGRGVVLAASYEARKFGIRSAMPSAAAHRRNPDTIFLPPNFEKYRAASGQIREIFHRYTGLVEPLSLDEAYLDVTDRLDEIPSATWIAQAIKRDIREETGLTASAGVAPNKFLAKIASDEKKPDGLFVIRPQDVARFLETLPLAKVPGIGKATRARFAELGVSTCGELQQLPRPLLDRHFGKRGGYFYNMARGIDERRVEPDRLRKSVGIEDTFAEDQVDPEWLRQKLIDLTIGLERRLRSSGVKGRTVTLKVRFADFHTITRSRTLDQFTDEAATIRAQAEGLLAGCLNLEEPVRLLGVSLSNLDNQPEEAEAGDQLALPGIGEGR
ncbi:MAG: DNA polymerase IV [SAR324 cluster bacterium]|nr:DNA polymerase IV [SAR324 cluster bacterium]